MTTTLYERDFYAWTQEQARLLCAGRLDSADVANIAEEIETMGRAEKRELVSRLAVLLLHLLKWRHQPGRRGASWEATVRVQRDNLADHLRDNPSLQGKLDGAVTDAYRKAAIMAVGKTGLAPATFPTACPWPWDRVIDDGFWPD